MEKLVLLSVFLFYLTALKCSSADSHVGGAGESAVCLCGIRVAVPPTGRRDPGGGHCETERKGKRSSVPSEA